MASTRLPILTLAVREQRYSCHGCGNCCRDFTVQLREEDLSKLHQQDWEGKLGQPVTIRFRGQTFLRQREDGSCIFLMDDGLCRIHKEFGFQAKPIACQLFPFHILPASGQSSSLVMGLNFACQSVLENTGAELRSHNTDLQRMAGELSELGNAAQPPMLNERLRASFKEAQLFASAIDRWLSRAEVDLAVRLDGLAWVCGSLGQAKLQNVREKRFGDLLDVLFGALPAELAHHPVEAPTARQMRMLRQAVFARVEDPKLSNIARKGRLRISIDQLRRSYRFKSGRGIAPIVGNGWPGDAPLQDVESVRACSDAHETAAIQDLMTRYLRATILAGRAWGAGYYGWPMIAGVQAMLLGVAAASWLARLHALGEKREALTVADVRAALGRIDRTAGRARWLGGSAERMRLAYLNMHDGLRRLLGAMAFATLGGAHSLK